MAHDVTTMAENERARVAYTAMERWFAAGHGLYHEWHPAVAGPRYAYEWPHTQALAAVLDLRVLGLMDERTLRACLRGLEWYWQATPKDGLSGYASGVRWPLGAGGDIYHDDNAWAGLNLLRAYRLTGDAKLLERAGQVFALLVAGWEGSQASAPEGLLGVPEPGHALAPVGGVFWKQQKPGEANHDRNTVSNAPSAALGLRLYAITHDEQTLAWARRMCEWVETHLRDADDGLYWDHLNVDESGACQVERTKWSYNQGTMLGAYVLLAQAHGASGEEWMARAIAVARASLRHFAGGQATTQDTAFNAIWLRNLLLLHAHTTPNSDSATLRADIEEALRAYAFWAWNSARDPATDLMRGRGAQGTSQVIDQAAMVQVLAMAACPASVYGDLV